MAVFAIFDSQNMLIIVIVQIGYFFRGKLNKMENVCHEQTLKIKGYNLIYYLNIIFVCDKKLSFIELKQKVERESDENRRLNFEIENLRSKNGRQVHSLKPRRFDNEFSCTEFNF